MEEAAIPYVDNRSVKSMWTYTAYILNGIRTKYGLTEIKITDLRHFIFETLFQKEKLVFWDGVPDLAADLRHLERLDLVRVRVDIIEILDEEKLFKVARIVENAPHLTKVGLLQTYNERIKKALESFQQDWEDLTLDIVVSIDYDITIGAETICGEYDVFELPKNYREYLQRLIKDKESKWIEEKLENGLEHRSLSKGR